MKFLMLFLFLLTETLAISQETDYRKFFHDNMFSEEGIEKIINRKTTNSVEYAYEGLANTMMAKYQVFPTSKLSSFNKGKAMIDKSINKYPNNLELRYIRLLVQLNAPSFLGYNNSINEDCDFIINNITTSDISSFWKKKFIFNICHTDGIDSKRKQNLVNLRNKL